MLIIEKYLYVMIHFVWKFKVIIRFFIIIGIFCLLGRGFCGWILLFCWRGDCRVRGVCR